MKAPVSRDSRANGGLQVLEVALALVEQLYGDPELTLGAIANEVGVSPRQLQRLFRNFASTTFREHLEIVRMQRADALLRQGASSRRTAQHVGYRQSAAFAKAFRRHFGLAPHQVLGGRGERDSSASRQQDD